jgi:ABC-type branched-subunit amino acid transport system substrate-binding protein
MPRAAHPLCLLALLVLAACAPAEEDAAAPAADEPATVEMTDAEEAPAEAEAPAETDAESDAEAPAEVAGRCAPTDPATVETIQIGGTAPLSAPGSVVAGTVMKRAMEIGVEHVNADGGVLGKDLELIFYDTAGLPEQGTAGMERLITQDCVVGVVGEYHSAVGLTMKDVAHKYHTPVVFAEPWNDDVTASGYPEVFRIAPTSSMVAEGNAFYLRDLGVEFVVIVAENTDYGVPTAETTERLLAEDGIESETFLAELGNDDWSPVIARIQALDRTPDAILVLVTGEASYDFENQAAEAGLMPTEDTVCVAMQEAINAEFWENVPDGNWCVFQKVGLVPAMANDVTRRFEADYREEYDRFPESYALESYDSVLILADAIERAGTLEPDAIIAALEATDFEGAQGRYHFPYGSQNPVPEDEPAWMWHQWPDAAVLFLQYYEQGQSGDDAAVVWPEEHQTHGTFLIPYGTTP